MQLRLAPYLRKPSPIFATGELSAYYTSGKHRLRADVKWMLNFPAGCLNLQELNSKNYGRHFKNQ